MTVALADQVECVERELSFRRRVYARKVSAGQMTQTQADKEIARMEAVLQTVRAAEERERLL